MGNEHLAPTICATVTQFITVVKCVVTTCLGDLSMTAQDRARVVELWIQVSKACQGLRKFPSLHAILSALQSCTIHQLKKTWVHVSRKSSQKFKKLLIKDQSVSRKLLMEEATSLLEILEMGPWGAQVRQQQQVRVPAGEWSMCPRRGCSTLTAGGLHQERGPTSSSPAPGPTEPELPALEVSRRRPGSDRPRRDLGWGGAGTMFPGICQKPTLGGDGGDWYSWRGLLGETAEGSGCSMLESGVGRRLE
nr:ral guanine nucleotide dissociation stimulator-like [Equus asinus]XP_044617351.1 ral guanine nucleotide dissociation stimulator-like [Equus asinus]